MKVNWEYYQIKYLKHLDRVKLLHAIRKSNESAAIFLYSSVIAGCILYIATYINLTHKG